MHDGQKKVVWKRKQYRASVPMAPSSSPEFDSHDVESVEGSSVVGNGLTAREAQGAVHFEGLTIVRAKSEAMLECCIDQIGKYIVSMPRQDIAAVVFDGHLNIMAYQGQDLAGVATYQCSPEVDFLEINFFITTKHKMGIGKALMSFLKQEAFREGVHFLTLYASIPAVGFFEKQGFSEYIHSTTIFYEHFSKY